MAIKFSNNARTELVSSIESTDTTITVEDASVFPTLSEGDVLYLTIANAGSTLWEIVKCTAIDGNVLTIVRGQEGTEPKNWTDQDNVSSRLTAELLETITSRNYQGLDVDDDVVFNSVQLAGGTGTQGRLSWNDLDKTIDVEYDGVTLQLGQEEHVYGKATEAIPDGAPVMFAGAQGDHILIARADQNVPNFNPKWIIGLATSAIVKNDYGYVTTFGAVRSIDTSAFAEGSILYLDMSSPGELTATPPSAPNHVITMAAVTRSHQNEGTLFVRPSWSLDLHELCDVDLEHGNIGDQNLLVYNTATNTWTDTSTPTVDYMDFRPAEDITQVEGRVYYNDEYKALTVYNDIAGSSLQVGHEDWIRVYNDTGSAIANGTPLYTTGSFGEIMTVAPADATTEEKARVIGVATNDIANNSQGVATVRGLISGIDTSGLTAGQPVHLSPSGEFQNAAPTYPYFPVDLGSCIVSDATNGYIYVRVENHVFEQLRVTGNQHVDGSLTIDGDFIVNGTQSIVSQNNLQIADSFVYLNSGDNIGPENTTFTGSGLDDAYLAGYYEGPTTTTYSVRIDGVGTGTGGVDTFEWSKDNFATTEATGVDITGGFQELEYDLGIRFNATTGHTSGDVWSGTAAPINTDTGWATNRNTGATGVGYTHMGVFFDASDEKFKFFDQYTPEPEGTIDVAHESFSLGTVVVDTLEGTATNASKLDDQLPSYYLNYNNFTNTPTIGNGGITITAGDGLGDGGSFALNDTSATEVTLTNTDKGSSQNIFKTISVPSQNSIIAGSNTDTVTIAGSGLVGVTTDTDNNIITISASETSHADVLVDGDFTANGFMKRTAEGVYAVDTNSYALSSHTHNYDNYGSWTISDGTNSEAIGSGSTLKIVGSGSTTTTYNAAENQLVINSVNAYVHPTHPGDDIDLDTGALTGATVISDLDFNVTTDTLGHVTDANATYSTRTLTATDIGAAPTVHTHSYLPLSGGNLTGSINMSGTQTITQAGFSGIEYYNTAGTWEVYIGTENNTGNVRYNSRLGAHNWYSNGTKVASLDSFALNSLVALEQQGNQVLHAGNYSSYAAPVSHTHSYLPLSGGTVNGTVTINSTSDNQLTLTSSNSWAGIGFNDGAAAGADYIWHNGDNSTFAIGGGGANVSGKKLHVHGGMTIGNGYAATANPSNGLNVEGAIQQAGNQVLHAGNYNSYAPTKTGGGASGTWGISITGNAATATSATSAGNADTTDGLHVHSGRNNEVNKIVRTDGNGYIQAGWINTTSGDNGTTAIDRVYASSDGYIRYYTPANFRTVLDVPTRGGSGASGTWGISITGNAATATKLATARTINGVAFDGTANITISGSDSTKLPLTGGNMSGNIGRTAHNTGYFVGGHNNIGSTATKTSPIYAIGTSYLPAESTLGNMYGVGFSHGTDASFISLSGATGWGQYVASDGDARIFLDAQNGVVVSTGSHRAPIFYDSDNTGYYADPASTSNFSAVVSYSYQGNGNVGGTGSAAWFPSGLYTAAGATNWMYGHIHRAGYDTYNGGRVDGSIFYDSNDTAYYLDINSFSRINRTHVNWPVTSSTSGPALRVSKGWENGIGDIGYDTLVVESNDVATIRVGEADGTQGGMCWGDSSTTFTSTHPMRFYTEGTAGNSVYSGMSGSLGLYVTGSSTRSPIFYDYNDTNYYCDPNGTSRLNGTHTNESYTSGWFRNYASGNGLYNQATGQHFYSDDDDYWNIAGGSAANGLRFRDEHAGTVRGYVYADNGNNIGFLNNSGNWRLRVVGADYTLSEGSSMRAPLFYDSNNTGYYVDAASTSVLYRLNINNNVLFTNYGRGMVGTYSSYRYQAVFAMGDSYKLPDDGTTTGSLYGMAWSHPNAGGAAGNLTDHGLLIINNGSFKCAISNSIVASGNITAYSDERLKKNWRDMPENYVSRLADVKVGIYERIDDEVTQVGVSAQSFQELLPEAIITAKDEMNTLSVSYGNAALASAVELAKVIVEQDKRIKRLEALIEKLI